MAASIYLNEALRVFESQLRLKGGVSIEVLAGTYTFGKNSPNIGSFDPNGSNRNMQLPAEEACAGFFGIYHNAGSVAANLVFLNDAAGTVATLPIGHHIVLACDGTAWTAIQGATLAAALATANTWTAKQTFGATSLGGIVDSPMTAVQVLTNAATITLPTTGINKAISAASAVTGIILTAGTVAGQLIVLENVNASGGDPITFNATPATSRVAQGTHAILAATAKLYTWNATAALWYPVG